MDNEEDMDGIQAIRTYIDRMVEGDGKCQGMKVLLLDASTTQIVSAVYSQTEILSNDVYLVSRLDDTKQQLQQQQQQQQQSSGKSSHLKAVCFVRPTETSVGLLVRELKEPRFSEYHFFFSGILTQGLLRLLAESDTTERVKQVQEFYGDFVPINNDLLTFQCRNTLSMSMAAGTSWAPQYAHLYERNLRGLQGILLSLKRQPLAGIRYAGQSACAEELAKDIFDAISTDEIFHFRKRRRNNAGALLLVLDRRDDPVTPLLSQWTYQAMVHELLGLNNHRVVLKGAPNIAKDLEEVVLSSCQDDFFRENRHKNFGELGENIQKLLQDYQKQTAQHNTSNLNTIEDMQAFMDKFPELRSRSHNVSKHVAIMGELARLVEVCSLMDISQFEQELACADDHTAHWRELMEKLDSPSVKIPDKLRLGLLYALRYETSGNINMVQQAMKKSGVPPDMVNLVPVMLRYGGSKSRGPGLYGDPNNIMSNLTKSFMTSVQGVQNVYAQHIPLLMDTIQSITKGKLRRDTHPFVPGSVKTVPGVSPETLIPDEIIVFIVGGVTYEEGTKIAEFNQVNRGKVQVILGGSTVHNSTSFLEELRMTK
uniref:Vacuolar protein sorting-associated protein 45 n=1 Tax=Pseudo-nitzschia australis TaxID=44445 RepID=A0A7S4AD30_9STRA|mmetsp:Transcript_20985/g.44282  ORF Transcript_20985/g.44282 Transcript_20985/m.44282 type:complete len:595 (+) Transcript_20985:120-1904(+)